MGINRVKKRGKTRIEVCKRWPDGTTFRRYHFSMNFAKHMLARIEGSIATGTWPELREELTTGQKQEDAPITVREFSARFLARIIHQRRKKRLSEPGFTTKDAVTGCWEVCSAEIGRWEVKNGVFGTQHSRRQLRNRVFGPSWAAKWGEVCPRRARRSLAQGMRS